MVNGNLAYKIQPEIIEDINPLAPDPLKYTSVALSEVFSNNTRLEASAFNLEAREDEKGFRIWSTEIWTVQS